MEVVVDNDGYVHTTSHGFTFNHTSCKECNIVLETTIDLAVKNERKRIKKIIKESSPDMVSPLEKMPYRQDLIDKWKVIGLLDE